MLSSRGASVHALWDFGKREGERGESRDPCVEGNGQAVAEPITRSVWCTVGLSPIGYVQGFLAHRTEEVGRDCVGQRARNDN